MRLLTKRVVCLQKSFFLLFAFCQVLDIREKGQGWTIQPHDLVCYWFSTTGFPSDAWMHDFMGTWEVSQEQTLMYSWMKAGQWALDEWPSDRVIRWQCHAEGIGATPTTGTHAMLAVYGALAKASDIDVKLLQYKLQIVWFLQQLLRTLQIACFFLSNFAGHALEIIGGIRSPLSSLEWHWWVNNSNVMSWLSRCCEENLCPLES